MTDSNQVVATLKSAVKECSADAEIADFEVRDDGSVLLAVEAQPPEKGAMDKVRDMADGPSKETDKSADETPEDDETDTNSTHVEGEVTTKTEDGQKFWMLNGEEKTYNDLQSEVSSLDTPYPEDTSGDNLANLLLNADSEADSTEQSSEDDTSNKSDTNDGNDTMSESELMSAGVDEENVKTVAKYRKKNGECAENGCVYGANDDSDYCASHQDSEKKSGNSDNSNSGSGANQSNADKVQQVTSLFGCTNTEAREAIEAEAEGLVATVKEGLELQE